MLLLAFLPLYALILTANLAPAGRAWRWVTLAALVFFTVLICWTGSVALLASPALLEETLQPDVAAQAQALNWRPAAGLLLLTALASAALLQPALRAALIARLRLRMEPTSTVHTVALVLAVWLVGLTVAQLLLTRQLPVEALTEGAALTLGQVWEQGVAFVLFAVLGVGLGLRRSLGETLARLGLTRPTPRHLALALGAILVLTLWDGLLSLLWQAVEPGSFERITGISDILFAGVMNPLGALSIGLAAGIGEELLFRGAIQPRFGLLLSTVLFTVGHTQYEFSPALFSVFVIGLVLGLIRQRANTTTAILVHAGYNALNVMLALA